MKKNKFLVPPLSLADPGRLAAILARPPLRPGRHPRRPGRRLHRPPRATAPSLVDPPLSLSPSSTAGPSILGASSPILDSSSIDFPLSFPCSADRLRFLMDCLDQICIKIQFGQDDIDCGVMNCSTMRL